MKGSYILLLRLSEDESIRVGSLGIIHFPRGYYAYVGSALGGFKSRLNRHLSKDKIPKWHIDYLLQRGSVKSVIICETERRVECSVAEALRQEFESISRFGCSDCKCSSHFFFATGEKQLRDGIMSAIKSLSLKGRIISAKAYRDLEAKGLG